MVSTVYSPQSVRIEPHGIQGLLGLCDSPAGLVIFAHGSGSGRFSPRNNFVANGLRHSGCATLLLDLLLPEEESIRSRVFDIRLLSERLQGAIEWSSQHTETAGLPIGLFGASTGAGAALLAAAHAPGDVHAIVSRGGRPDLAGPAIQQVRAPTLLLVGSLDREVIHLNQYAFSRLNCEKDLVLIPGATHLFEEPGTLEEVLVLASKWFIRHFSNENH